MGRLNGKIALITGAAGGIGGATANLFAAEGATVIAADIAQTASFDDSAIEYARLDVADEGEWSVIAHNIADRHGGIDILVNGAGVGNLEDVENESLDAWDRVVRVNQSGTFIGIREAVPQMRRRGGGSIVNISSVFCITAVPGLAAYHASKGAIRALSKNAALTYAPDNIRVNSIHPGITRTAMVAGVPDEINAATISRTPLRRMADPTEIAYGILFLASDEASFVTGVELPVDGGYLAF